MEISALIMREQNTNKVIGAVGIEDSSSIVYFRFLLPKDVTVESLRKLTSFFNYSEEYLYIETEPYHIVGDYGDYSVAIESIPIPE